MPKGSHGSKAPHGTRARYNTHGCRCEACVKAGTQYQTKRRRQKGIKPRTQYLAEIKAAHGTESRYQRGCRCEPCRHASNQARRLRNAANPELTRARWREQQRRRRTSSAPPG